MFYKLYDIYTQNDKKILTAPAGICAEFMGFANNQSFYDYIRKSKDEKMMCNNGFYAKESSVKPERKCKEITDAVKVILLKDLLVPQQIENNIKRLVKIKKNKVYLYDKKINKNENTVILAVKITQIDKTKRKYRDVLKIPRKEFNLYFKKAV